MKIPYGKIELQLAFFALDNYVFDEKKMKEFEKEVRNIAPSEDGSSVKEFVEKLEEKFGLTEKEAWSIVADAEGLLS